MVRKHTLKERITRAFDEAKKAGRVGSQAELAKKIGIERASVNAWFSGETHSIDGANLTKAADILGVSAHWLATGEGGMVAAEPRANYGLAPILAWEYEGDLPPGDYIQIPRFAVSLSAGQGDEQRNLGFQFHIEFNRGETLAFRTDWIRKMRLNPSKLVSMRVYGDSMEERLHDGDAVVIDTSQTEVLDGKVYALWYDGGERVKRLHRMPGGGLLIRSDNEAKYPPLSLTADQAQTVRIIGRVVHISGEGGL
jgi:phage repressor protein C with HTH and peptisase S24 domain